MDLYQQYCFFVSSDYVEIFLKKISEKSDSHLHQHAWKKKLILELVAYLHGWMEVGYYVLLNGIDVGYIVDSLAVVGASCCFCVVELRG